MAGVKYDENFVVTYDMAHTLEESMAFRFSKYVEPAHGDIYRKTLEALKTGKPVLFTGSPCKIAGLKNYLKKDYDNLYLIDLICACTASPKVFKKYLAAKEKEKNAKIVSCCFRSAVKAWEKKYVQIEYADSTSECMPGRKNEYAHYFAQAFLAKPSCYKCEFAGDNKLADLTIGDFWKAGESLGIKSDHKGYSALKIGTEKGMKLFEAVQDKLFTQEVSLETVYHENHAWPAYYPARRATVIREILDSDLKDTMTVFRKCNPYL